MIGTFHSKYRQDLEHSFKTMPWCVPIIMRRILDFFNACDEVWIPQAYVEDTVREYGYKGPLQVVENGNDFAGIVDGDLTEYKRLARQKLQFKDDELNLLFVGQHIWEKGLRVIVDSLSELKGRIRFHMNFIGTGYAASELSEIIRNRGLEQYVDLRGVISDRNTLCDYYAASDLFVFPSLYDNAPLVVREAAAMGTPSLLTEGSTASEVVKDSCNGFLSGKDSRSFADAIIRIDRDRRHLEEVARNARDSLVRSWEDVVGEVSDRYDVILRNYRR